jgi:hypothetical protein
VEGAANKNQRAGCELITTPDPPQKMKNVQLFITAPTPGFHLAFLGVAAGRYSHCYARNLGSGVMMRSTTS